MALTKRAIDRLEYDPAGPGQQVLFDETLAGFGCRVYPSGKKSFILRYRTAGGRTRLLTLGRYGALTLDQGRERAQRALLAVRDGGDPLESRVRSREALSVDEFSPIYLEEHAKRRKKSWKEDERRLTKHVLPSLGKLKLETVSRGDVASLHRRMSVKTPVEANRVLALVSKLFAVAVELEYLPANHGNPASGIAFNAERSRDRWADEEEVPRLLQAIAAEADPYIRGAFLLYLLTGLRRSELLGLQWKDVSLSRRELFLADTKANRSHRVPLSTAALEVLKGIPREAGNDYVLPGRSGGGRYDLKRPWIRIRQAAKLENFRLHDLRRTVGSWLATYGGASLPLIGKVLNHSNVSTTQIYGRIADTSARNALEDHGVRIMGAMTPAKAPRRLPIGRPVRAKRKPGGQR